MNKRKIQKQKQELKLKEDGFFKKNQLGLILLVFTFILYGNTIPNDYSLDDVYVTNNEQVKKGFRAIPEIITSLYATNVFEDGEKLNFGYRPVVKISFAIEYGLFGNNPHISHFLNLLLYFFTLLVLLRIMGKVFQDKSKWFILVVLLLFAAHPLHTEVVSSLKNRDELLSFLFCMLSLYFFAKYLETNKIMLFAVADFLFIIAVFSKISAIVFIVLIPLTLVLLKPIPVRKIIFILFSLIVVFFLAKLYQHSVLPGSFRPKMFIENPLLGLSLFERIPSGFYIALFLLRLLVFPHPMRFYYGYDMIPISQWGDITVIISILIIAILIISAILAFKKHRILSFGILFLLINMTPYMNILKPAMGIIGDRFLYSPSFGFSIVLAFLIFKISGLNMDTKLILQKNKTKLYFIVAILLIFFSAKTIDRNKDWKDQMTLLEADMPYLEKSAKANFIYAGSLKAKVFHNLKNGQTLQQNSADINKIIEHLNQSIRIYPEYHQSWNMLATINYTLYKDHEKAIPQYLKAIEISPLYTPAYANLAWIYTNLKDFEKAEEYYLELVKIKPNNLNNRNDLVAFYLQMGDSVSAARQKLEMQNMQNNSAEFTDFFK